jgi:O-antigen/teichoic acid export membrane protein
MLRSAWGYAFQWKGRISYALLDQSCSGASSFILTVLVARSVPIESFGAYALVWSISLCCESISTSLVNDPLPAIVSEQRSRLRTHLLRAASWVNLSLAGVISLAIIGSALLVSVWSTEVGLQLALLAIVNPSQRLQCFIRRLCYLQNQQSIAAAASFASATVLLGGATALSFADMLSAPAAVLLWGAAAGATILVGIATGIWRPGATRYNVIIGLIWRFWRSGRWLLGASSAYWISNSILPFAAIYAGPAAAGILRALQLLFIPVTQANSAIAMTLVPRLAEIVAGKDQHRMRSIGPSAIILFVMIALLYSSALLAMSESVLARLYDQKMEFTAAAGLLWPLALGTIAEAATQGAGAILLAAGQSRTIFLARMFSALVFLLAVAALVPRLGLAGIVWAYVTSPMAVAVAYAPSVFALLYKRPQSQSSRETFHGLDGARPTSMKMISHV